MNYIYFLACDHVKPSLVKIGRSNKVGKRICAIQTQSPVQVELIGLMRAPAETEKHLHWRFAHLRSHGEWFRLTPDLMSYIADNAALPDGFNVRDFNASLSLL